MLLNSLKASRCYSLHLARDGGVAMWHMSGGGRLMLAFYTQSFFLEPQTTKDSLGLSSVSPPTQRGYLTVKYHGLTPETAWEQLGITVY